MEQLKSITIKEGVMKKLLLGITILAFVVIASSAMAAGLKPPKALCLDWVSYADYHELVIKSMGTVQTTGGPVKMYTISGYVYGIASHPVQGSGYVTPGTSTFHATYNGQGTYLGNTLRTFELFFDLGTNSGTINGRYLYGNATEYSSTANGVVSTNCAALPIPTGMAASANERADGE
jgi:hypothetical protein